MLRASSQTHAEAVDLQVVMDRRATARITHGEQLVALAEAVVGGDDAAIADGS